MIHGILLSCSNFVLYVFPAMREMMQVSTALVVAATFAMHTE